MIPTTPEALVAGALLLVHDHGDLIASEAGRRAQRRQLEEVAALARDQDPPVRGATAVAIFGRLVDCLRRLERAAQDAPGLVRVRDRLRAWRAELEVAHARALTQGMHRGPVRRPATVKPTGGWNRPG